MPKGSGIGLGILKLIGNGRLSSKVKKASIVAFCSSMAEVEFYSVSAAVFNSQFSWVSVSDNLSWSRSSIVGKGYLAKIPRSDCLIGGTYIFYSSAGLTIPELSNYENYDSKSIFSG